MRDFKNVKELSTTRIGRGYVVCMIDNKDATTDVALRHDGRYICTLHTRCYGEWQYLKTIDIMSRIMYLIDQIQSNTDNSMMLYEWLDDMLKHWGDKIYGILDKEFKRDMHGINNLDVNNKTLELFKNNDELLKFALGRILDVAKQNIDVEEQWCNMDADQLGHLNVIYEKCVRNEGNEVDWDEIIEQI